MCAGKAAPPKAAASRIPPPGRCRCVRRGSGGPLPAPGLPRPYRFDGKDGGVIGQRGQAAGYIRLELLPVIGGGEETDYVDLLPGAQLHPRRASRSRSSAARQKAAQLPQVLWSVRATISSPASAHMGRQVGGGSWSSLPQGRQAGMEVEIVVILHVELLFEITGRRRACRPKRAGRRAERFRRSENLAAGRIHSARGSKRGSPPGVAGWGDRQECR